GKAATVAASDLGSGASFKLVSLLQHDWLLRFFDDFFEARIAAQRVPHRIQAQIAISWTTRNFGDGFKLLERQISFSHPGTNHGKGPCCTYLSWTPPEHCFLCGGRQFHCAPAFAQRLLLSCQECIDLRETKK